MKNFPLIILLLLVFFIMISAEYNQNSKTSGVFLVTSCTYDTNNNCYKANLVDTLTGAKIQLNADSLYHVGSILNMKKE